MNKYPRVGVAVLVAKQGRFLMGQRSGAHGAGTWAPPGGAVEFGEHWENTGHRELAEETGLAVSSLDFVGVTSDYSPEWETHWLTIWLIGNCASDASPIVTEPYKFTNLSWHYLFDLPEPLFLPVENMLRSTFYTNVYYRIQASGRPS